MAKITLLSNIVFEAESEDDAMLQMAFWFLGKINHSMLIGFLDASGKPTGQIDIRDIIKDNAFPKGYEGLQSESGSINVFFTDSHFPPPEMLQ